MVGFLAALGVYAAVCSLLWLGFVRLEGLLEDDARIRIADWVRGEGSTDDTGHWPATFVDLFDRVFGENHLSWRCFGRSCVASAMAVAVMTAVFAMVEPRFADVFIRDPGLLIGFGMVAVFLNLLPDYLSLLETRYVLRRMAGREKAPAPGPAMLSAWLVIDAAVTLAIISAAFYLLAILLSAAGYISPPWFSDFVEELWAGLFMFEGGKGSAVGVFIYSTFVTSVWLWLYAFSGIAVRLVNRVKRIRDFLDRNLRLEDRPLSVMGGVLVVLFTLGYWPLVVWNGVV